MNQDNKSAVLEKKSIGKKDEEDATVAIAPEVVAAVGKKSNRKIRVEVATANELLKKPFLNEFEVSEITGRAVSTLRNDRFLRRGIPYLKISKRSIRYRTPEVMNFMEARPINFDAVAK